jgi:hypothetical protein
MSYRTLTNLPPVLAFDIGGSADTELTMSKHYFFPEILVIGKHSYSLISRICATHTSSVHFQCLLKLDNGLFLFDALSKQQLVVPQESTKGIVGTNILSNFILYGLNK